MWKPLRCLLLEPLELLGGRLLELLGCLLLDSLRRRLLGLLRNRLRGLLWWLLELLRGLPLEFLWLLLTEVLSTCLVEEVLLGLLGHPLRSSRLELRRVSSLLWLLCRLRGRPLPELRWRLLTLSAHRRGLRVGVRRSRNADRRERHVLLVGLLDLLGVLLC